MARYALKGIPLEKRITVHEKPNSSCEVIIWGEIKETYLFFPTRGHFGRILNSFRI